MTTCHHATRASSADYDVTHTVNVIFSQKIIRTRSTKWPTQIRWSRASIVFHFSIYIFIISAFVHFVSCQSTLQFSFTPPASTYFQEENLANITCSVSTSATLSSGGFPLSWSRNSGDLPDGSTVKDSRQGSGGTFLYQSTITFVPTALDNQVDLVCAANFDTENGSATFTPLVILVPDEPVITGPTEVDAGTNTTWTCVSSGASRIAPNVYWRDKNGFALVTGLTKTTTYIVVPNQNGVYSITTTIALPLPADGARYTLTCTVVHELGRYNMKKTTSTNITVYFPPQITKNGDNVIYTNEGLRPALSCVIVISNPPATSVSWTKDGLPIDFSSGRYGQVSVNSPNLTILSALRSDRGDYVCTVTNPKGSTSFTTPTTLIVRYPPTINSTGNNTNYEGSAGGTLTIQCPVDAVPPPTNVTWKRILNGQVLTLNLSSNSQYHGGTADQNYALTIDPLQASDAGTYFCEASNEIGTGKGNNNTVTVNYNPVVNIHPAQSVPEGSNFTIYCKITMYPAVTSVTWFKGTVRLNIAGSSGKYSDGTVQNQSLSVTRAVKTDGDTYTCQGSNGTATVSGTTVVTVTYIPIVTVPSANITKIAGETITISCTFDAVPPASSIIWLKRSFNNSSSPVVVATDGRISGGNLSTPSLTITDLKPDDMATYYCVVNNSIGESTSGPVNLIVQYKPIVNVTSSPLVVEIGKEFILTCDAVAYPPVINYVWYQDGVMVGNSPAYRKVQASISDYTNFVCEVRNLVGISYGRITPNIVFVPVLAGSGEETIIAPLGSSVRLECLVTANPEPTYSWFRNASGELGYHERVLYINLTSKSDFGGYSCSAENSLGILDPARNFTIIEGVPPVAGGPIDGWRLNAPSIILIIIIIIIFILILILLIILCCAQGICGRKKERAKVSPTVLTTARSENGRLSVPPANSKPLYSKPNETISLDDNRLSSLPSSRPVQPLGGSIISVPESSGPRAHHLPPLDSVAESAANAREDENLRSRKKKKKHKNEERSALTGAEETTDGNTSAA